MNAIHEAVKREAFDRIRASITRCGDIGTPQRHIEFEPLTEPTVVPLTVPAVPEKVPA